MENLNTHHIASLYETFKPKKPEVGGTTGYSLHTETRRLDEYGGDRTQRPERTMPRSSDSGHGTMQTEVAAWEKDRNNSAKKINWQFTPQMLD